MLQNIYEGEAWHGPSIVKALEGINAPLAFKKFQKIHSIAELTDHMVVWKKFTIERLKGNDRYDVTENINWKKFSTTDEDAWNNIKNDLHLMQEEFINSLDHISDMKLTDLVFNKAYDYYTLLHGVVQHDIYHAGQISLLKKY